MASLALASLTINTIGKRSVRRARPVLDPVPLVRQLKRQPITTSFPSGHSASAAAFATGVALESPGWGRRWRRWRSRWRCPGCTPGCTSPSDVLAGAARRRGAAFLVRRLVPARAQLRRRARPRAEAPALPEGDGLVVVANRASGTAERVRARTIALPRAEIVECAPEDVPDELAKAAARARVLGVCGGDGTVNAAAQAAVAQPAAGGAAGRHPQPLRLRPGVEDERQLARAIRHGEAVRVDAGRFATRDTEGLFLNTLSLGVYPELVRVRERWSRRIGGWPAGVLAAVRVLRADRHPLEVELGANGGRCGCCSSATASTTGWGSRRAAVPIWRTDCWTCGWCTAAASPRCGLAAAVAGPLTRSPGHAAVQVNRLRLTGLAPETPLAYDGEVTAVSGEVELEKLPGGADGLPPLNA